MIREEPSLPLTWRPLRSPPKAVPRSGLSHSSPRLYPLGECHERERSGRGSTVCALVQEEIRGEDSGDR